MNPIDQMAVQPARQPRDGKIQLTAIENGDSFLLGTMTDGRPETAKITRYNAFRLFALLATQLRIPIHPEVTARIEFGGRIEAPGKVIL